MEYIDKVIQMIKENHNTMSGMKYEGGDELLSEEFKVVTSLLDMSARINSNLTLMVFTRLINQMGLGERGLIYLINELIDNYREKIENKQQKN